MVRDGHTRCSGVGGFKEHDQREVFEEGSKQYGMDSFCFRGSNQSVGLERNHSSISKSEDKSNSRWEKYLPR